MRLLRPSLFLGVPIFFLFSGCKREATPPELVDFADRLPLRIAEVDLEAQIALTPSEQRNGLMRRQSLPDDSGMLFPYRQPQSMSFWMANTPLALDIGFFDEEGVLREIHRMIPYDRSRTTSSSDQIQFALEMERGWFAENNLFPGSRMDLPLLREALERRGADPAEFGL